ncbi:MAG: FAD/NAD(P)-binding protein [Alphaproteobacteria bacterium]|nr:FAD/NAD(P)-binding protein [Alphaproteobacteria bacterium]
MNVAMQQLADPMDIRPFRIEKIRKELADTFTMELVPEGGGSFAFKPGQFNMLYTFGAGEVPISISGDPADPSKLVHTIRRVGSITQAIGNLSEGMAVGVRGPFGTPWPVEEAFGSDLVILAGGLGLAPLRPAIYMALANRHRFGKVVLLYGSRSPAEILFPKELEKWRGRFDTKVRVTVDRAEPGWGGHVGVVTKLVTGAGFDPMHTVAFVCGPEIMMRYGIQALEQAGIDSSSIYVSMERNMKCGIGLCGHCQWGAPFVCKDGPVFRFDEVADAFKVREL